LFAACGSNSVSTASGSAPVSSSSDVLPPAVADEYQFLSSVSGFSSLGSSFLQREDSLYFTYNSQLYKSEGTDVSLVKNNVEYIAGKRQDDLLLILPDPSAPAVETSLGSSQTSLYAYNPATRQNTLLYKGAHRAVLPETNGNTLFLATFEPYTGSYGYQLQISLYNLDTQERTPVFSDEYVSVFPALEGQEAEAPEAAYAADFELQENAVLVYVKYPYPSEYPYVRTLTFSRQGELQRDSEEESASSSNYQPETPVSIDCGSYQVTRTYNSATSKYRYTAEIDGKQQFIAEDASAIYEATPNGLFYYKMVGTPSSDGFYWHVYNGKEIIAIPNPHPALPESTLIPCDGKIYFLFYNDYSGNMGTEAAADRVALYQATGTAEDPTAVAAVFPTEGSAHFFIDTYEWYFGLNYCVVGHFLLIDNQTPNRIFILNTTSNQYSTLIAE
ncbi:MAG: hypothetical protein ACK5L3_12775, partial [Oscillospiraceae bacterium]